MQLMRRTEAWDPMRELEDLGKRFNRLFEMNKWTGVGEREALTLSDWAPSVNISEDDKEYRVRVELPGVKKPDVHVTYDNGILAIQGERKEEREEKGLKFHRKELAYGNFVRRFAMPDDGDEGKIDAKFNDGILTVTITKAKSKKTRSHEIAVQ